MSPAVTHPRVPLEIALAKIRANYDLIADAVASDRAPHQDENE
jgi:hypothetical protein